MKKSLSIGVISLFILSALAPIGLGLNVKTSVVIEPEATAVSDGPMDSAWSMQSHDIHHTGRSLHSTADNLGIEKWRFECDWIQDTPIIADDGTIYVGGGYDDVPWYLIAINPDGTLKWRYKTNGLLAGSSPAIDEDGTIYVGSWDTGLYAINPNGTKKWRVGIGGSIASSPVIGDDGTIYVGHMENDIVAVNPNGTIKWRYKTGSWVTSDPAIDDEGIIYIGSADSYLYAMYPNGTLKWRYKTGDMIKGHPSITDDNTIYIGSFDGYLYALYSNGTIKWKCHIPPGTEINPSIAEDGTIYTGFNDLIAVNPDGTIKWSFKPGSGRFFAKSSPAISAEGTIYIGTNIGDASGGEIIAVNPDGTERWRKKIAYSWVDSSPSIGEDGTVYIGSAYDIKRGYLHAFGNIESNEPPEAPIIEGPKTGKKDEEYWFYIRANDPDNNPISLYIDWGDGDIIDWYREQASGETWFFEHGWSTKGNFTIRAKAKDVFDEESGWTEFDIEITRPRTRTSSHWMQLLDMFPLLKEVFLRLIG